MSENEKVEMDRKGPGVAWYAMDAVVFVLALYKLVEYTLLCADGVSGGVSLAAVAVVLFGCVALLRRRYAEFAGVSFLPGLLFEFAVMGGLAGLMARLSFVQRKTQSFSWLALEWHKLPDNHMLLARVSPGFTLCVVAVSLLVVWLFSRGKRWGALCVAGPLLALTLHQCSVVTKEQSYAVYLITYAGPVALVCAAAVAGMPRLGARATVMAAAALMLLWHYMGWVPLILDKSFTKMPGVEKLYPAPGAKPDFPLAFFRDFQVEPSGGRLFTAYGPTSGVIRFDLRRKKLDLLDTPGALVRYVSLDPEHSEFYALDWVSSDMLTLSMDTMKVLSRENMYFNDGLYVPVHFIYSKGRIYSTYSERPGVAEFTVKPLRLRRRVMFRDEGMTRFRSGVWKEALDEEGGKLFVELGMTDLRGKFTITRVDLKTFRVDDGVELPEGGLELLAIPQHRTVMATSFFGTGLYEYDMDTLTLRRRIEGPRSCRNLVYDAKRKLLIGTGFLDGELVVMDYESGRELSRTLVGNKAASLFLAPDGDTLYLGGTWGIFRVELDKFLSSARGGKS